MKQMVCEMCGGTDLIKQDGVFVFQTCGCKYSIEEEKKMMIEGNVDVSGSTVKVDTSDELKNLYELARRAKTDGNSENAEKYYSQIITKDPSSWEANFYTTYYQSMNCKIGEIGIAAARIVNCVDTVFKLIKDSVADADEQRKAVDEVATKCISISTMLFNAYKNYYDDIDIQIKDRYVQEYANNCSMCRDINYTAGNAIIIIFGDMYGDIAASLWEVGVRQHNILNGVFKNKQVNAQTIESYNEKIKKYNNSYIAPQTNMSSDGGCYVATAVYGSYNCPEVWTLRRYRDYELAETWYGRAFIHTYYAISPTLVKWFGHTNWFKKMWKRRLDYMVKNLQGKGYRSTPYEDRRW